MKNISYRTDMADERVSEYKKKFNKSKIDGVKVRKINEDLYTLTYVEVLNDKGEKALGKKKGKYVSLEILDTTLLEDMQKEKITEIFSEVINNLLKKYKAKSVLVVGLGNKSVTPDSLGPKVIDKINVTRHLFEYAKEFVTEEEKIVSAISPGVLGTTGIEVCEIVEAISKKIKPDLVLVIDSLASISKERVGKSLQITDTGIAPGAGVQNRRKELSMETLNIPVIAIGVPFVVDVATITFETIKKLDKEIEYKKIIEILDTENYMVTPKEIDIIVEDFSNILAKSINKVLE